MKFDQMEKLGHSLVQHGSQNERIYLMKLGEKDLPQIAEELVEMATDRGYTKIFAKVPASAAPPFKERAYVEEARIPGFFGRKEDGVFLSRFLTSEREKEEQPKLVADVLHAAGAKQGLSGPAQLGEGQSCRKMTKDDAQQMTQVYRKVFASYPFPIHEADYLIQTMDENVIYYGIWSQNKLVALSSAEIDYDNQNAEMTDFATLPEFRGHGLANFLLEKMEADIRQIGIHTAYTIARAYSYGMNITFAKQGYHHGGTLTKNTQISGSLETMNIWYKSL